MAEEQTLPAAIERRRLLTWPMVLLSIGAIAVYAYFGNRPSDDRAATMAAMRAFQAELNAYKPGDAADQEAALSKHVARVSAIDTSACPEDVQAAFSTYLGVRLEALAFLLRAASSLDTPGKQAQAVELNRRAHEAVDGLLAAAERHGVKLRP